VCIVIAILSAAAILIAAVAQKKNEHQNQGNSDINKSKSVEPNEQIQFA
jgi:Mn2+/Fe2+ NRAMP family transporter